MQPDEYFAAELARLQRGTESGNLPSAIEAMHLCAWNGLPWPEWLAIVAIRCTEQVFLQSERSGAGRFTMDRDLMRRYQAASYWVARLHDEKARWRNLTAEQKKRAKALGLRPLLYAYHPSGGKPEFDKKAYPLTRIGAFEAATDMVRAAEPKATLGSVRKAYYDILKAIKNGSAERVEAAAKSLPMRSETVTKSPLKT